MYVKFFSNKKGGSSASINYLLNEREKEGTAKILKGDRALTENIIKSISNKQKVTVGVLSFEEQSLTAAQKEELMAEFEKTIFAGMSPDEYNILWVEHTDKARLEMNFVIPKIHLPTQKAFNPYFHEVDFPRVEMFEDIYNIKFNLSSKKDPSKAQTLLGAKKEFNLYKDYQQLDELLHELVQSRDIQNRGQMIELLTENNIEVTRTGKDYMSIKLPDSKKAKKFKGSIYNEQFTSLEELETISKATDRRIKEFHSRDTSRELEQTIKRLDSYNEQKAQHNREKYKLNNARYTRAERVEIQPQTPLDSDINNSLDISIRGNDISRVHTEISRTDNVASSKRDETPRRERKIHQESKSTVQQRQDNDIHQDRGIEYDTRRRTLERIRARTEEQQRAYKEARRARAELYKSITATAKSIREQSKRDSIATSREYETITEQSRELISRASEVVQESKSSVRLFDELNGAVTTRERIINAITAVYDRVKEFGAELKERFSTAIQQSESLTRTAESYKLKIEREQEPEPSYSYGMRMR